MATFTQNTNVRMLRNAVWILTIAISISGYLTLASLDEQRSSLEEEALRFQNKLNEFNSIYNSERQINSEGQTPSDLDPNDKKKKQGSHSGQPPIVLPPHFDRESMTPTEPLPGRSMASLFPQTILDKPNPKKWKITKSLEIDSIDLRFIDIPNPYNRDLQTLRNIKIKINNENITPIRIVETPEGYSLHTSYPISKLKDSNKIIIMGTAENASQSVNYKKILGLELNNSDISLGMNGISSTVAINVKNATISKR